MLILTATVVPAAASAPCDMNPAGPAQRVFAQEDSKHAWAEFRNIESVPSLDLESGISAEVWNEADVAILVRTVQPGEDFWIYTEYCFAENGPLVYCDLEVRTAWGWGYHTGGPIADGRFHSANERFFDTKKNQSIPKPHDADDISDSLRPTIYADTGRLPFWELIEKGK
ncbi:MAG TPA: hypothetical protein VME23_04190 [Terracidiphilus sp.]|nr:hypothetical protein [Terracidiphilus sp.]